MGTPRDTLYDLRGRRSRPLHERTRRRAHTLPVRHDSEREGRPRTGDRMNPSPVNIYFDSDGFAVGYSGRARSKAEFKAQMANLRALGVE